MRIILTNTGKQALALETALIKSYKPRDNSIMYELILEHESIKMLNEYNETSAETPYWEIDVPF